MRKLLSTWDNIKNTKVCLFTVLSSISWFTPEKEKEHLMEYVFWQQPSHFVDERSPRLGMKKPSSHISDSRRETASSVLSLLLQQLRSHHFSKPKMKFREQKHKRAEILPVLWMSEEVWMVAEKELGRRWRYGSAWVGERFGFLGQEERQKR